MSLWERWQQAAVLKELGLSLSARWLVPVSVGRAKTSMVWLGDGAKEMTGFSLDPSARMRTLKSVMEALEGFALEDAQLDVQSRTGIAAHRTSELAQRSAFSELVERDAFLFHWLSESPGSPVAASALQGTKLLTRDLAERYSPRAVRLRSAVAGVEVVLIGSRSSQHGCWFLGLGTGGDAAAALSKAVLEWLSAVFRHENFGGCPVDRVSQSASLERTDRAWIVHHHHESKDPGVSALLDRIFARDALSSEPLNPLAPSQSQLALRDQTQYQELPTRSDRYRVVHARNSQLLALRFGPDYRGARQEYLANPRLRGALPERFQHHAVDEFLPHPFD